MKKIIPMLMMLWYVQIVDDGNFGYRWLAATNINDRIVTQVSTQRFDFSDDAVMDFRALAKKTNMEYQEMHGGVKNSKANRLAAAGADLRSKIELVRTR